MMHLLSRNGWAVGLPTEAEWEYTQAAEAAGTSSTREVVWTPRPSQLDGNYPYSTCGKGTYLQKTMPVGSYAPNAWGLYEMHGNVLEWCSDRYGKYSSGAQTNSSQSKGRCELFVVVLIRSSQNVLTAV